MKKVNDEEKRVRNGALGRFALAVGLCLSISGTWLAVRSPTAAESRRSEPAREDDSEAELEELRRAVSALESRVARRDAPAQEEAAVQADEVPEEATEVEDPMSFESEMEKHREVLTSFDVALAEDDGDMEDRAAAASNMERDLTTSIGDDARVIDVKCGATFCKATLEEDTEGRTELDTAALVDAASSLRYEAMFDYQREGSIKRTIIYAAREGQLLPMERGSAPSTSGVTGPALL